MKKLKPATKKEMDKMKGGMEKQKMMPVKSMKKGKMPMKKKKAPYSEEQMMMAKKIGTKLK